MKTFFANYLLKTDKNKLLGINPMGLSSPMADSIDIIALWKVKKGQVSTQ